MIDLTTLYQQLFSEKNSLAAIALDMKQENAFRRCSALLQQNGVRFSPLKGADLAWRVYPKELIRPKCDLDLLIHPDDYARAVELLQKDGWQTPYRYRTNRHDGIMFRHGVALEPHFNLPGTNASSERIWPELKQMEGSRHQLPLELNLLMLFNHTREHHWFNGRRLVMDSALLVQAEGIPDWIQIKRMAERFQMAAPDLLFAAFPECFPDAARPENSFPAELCDAFRQLVLNSTTPFEGRRERIMKGERKNGRWWLERLRGMSPSSIRLQTGNPRGHYGKLLSGYWQVGWKKLKTFCRWRSAAVDPAIRERLQKEKLVEESLRK